jgi:hypothetical protein
MTTRAVSVLLFIAACISVIFQMVAFHGTGYGPGWETVSIARSLAAGNGFSNPYAALPTGPTAHLAPLFPAMLAALLRVFGFTPSFVLASDILCIAAHALYCVLFIPLSKELFDDPTPGLIAGAFSAIVPTIQVLPQWEAIYAAVAAQLFCLASARLLRAGRPALAGALCGVLLLLHPAMLFVAAAWLAYLRPPSRRIATFAIAAALLLVPWTIRNYRVFHAVFFIRDNLGSELYQSNADCADARDAANPCHPLLQPNYSLREATLVRDLGEHRYNRLRMADALRWIGDHPARFRDLTLRRIREFWFPTPERPPVYEYSRWLVSILFAVALVQLIRTHHRSTIFFAASMALYPVLYYLVQASTRYRSPVLWISVLPAAYALLPSTRRGATVEST